MIGRKKAFFIKHTYIQQSVDIRLTLWSTGLSNMRSWLFNNSNDHGSQYFVEFRFDTHCPYNFEDTESTLSSFKVACDCRYRTYMLPHASDSPAHFILSTSLNTRNQSQSQEFHVLFSLLSSFTTQTNSFPLSLSLLFFFIDYPISLQIPSLPKNLQCLLCPRTYIPSGYPTMYTSVNSALHCTCAWRIQPLPKLASLCKYQHRQDHQP